MRSFHPTYLFWQNNLDSYLFLFVQILHLNAGINFWLYCVAGKFNKDLLNLSDKILKTKARWTFRFPVFHFSCSVFCMNDGNIEFSLFFNFFMKSFCDEIEILEKAKVWRYFYLLCQEMNLKDECKEQKYVL